MYHNFQYKYARPALAVDCIIFGYNDPDLYVLLIRRNITPFKGEWALPGGFVHIDETIDDAAKRVLTVETGITNLYMEQLYTFGAIDRDPRERVVSIAYFSLINISEYRLNASNADEGEAQWFKISAMPYLAFDHQSIMNLSLMRLQAKITYQPIVFELLPEKFTFGQLENIYAAILQKNFDRRNFRKKVLAAGFVDELTEIKSEVSFRPPKYFKFNKEKYSQKTNKDKFFEM